MINLVFKKTFYCAAFPAVDAHERGARCIRIEYTERRDLICRAFF